MCDTRHRTWQMTARCEFPYARVRGEGRHAVILPSSRWTVELFASQREALQLYSRYQRLGARLRVLTRHGRPRR
jgi:hypothetical protein